MSRAVYEELLVKAAQDEKFASWARGNIGGLRQHYDLTETEATTLAGLTAEPATAAAAGPKPVALEARRSKSGFFAIGGVAAVVTTATAIIGVNLLNRPAGTAEADANSGHPTLAIISVEATGASNEAITLTCGGGRSAIAGGFAILDGAGAPVAAPGLKVMDNHPTASGWMVRLTGAPAGAQIQSRATCAQAASDGVLSAAFDGVQGYEVIDGSPGGGRQRVNCHPGRVPLGGGFTGGQASLAVSAPAVLGYEMDDPTRASSGAVVCALGGQDVSSQVAIGALGWQLVIGPTTALSGKVAVAMAPCPAGWHTAGGGYSVDTGRAVVSGNLPAGDAWEVDAVAAGGAASVTPYAVCVI
ncbi:MAG: hypothetical protein QOE92_2477 [Chloroflexota bacterium]|jgi:hypothetical protein|nr:hypothetical protein [Chloroflexota bacterium]